MKNGTEKNKEKKKMKKKKLTIFFFLHNYLNLFHLFLFFYVKLNSLKMHKF